MPLTDLFEAAMQGAAAKGTELLNKPVELAVRGAQQGGWEAVGGSLKGFSLAFPVSYSQDANGTGLILMDARYAALIAELLLESDPSELPAEISELQLTAAADTLSQMVAASGEVLGRASRRRVLASVGELTKLSGDGLAAARGTVREASVAVIDCELRIGNHPPSRLVHVIPATLADQLVAERAGPSAPDIGLGAAQGAGQRVQAVQLGTFGASGGAGDAPTSGNLELLMDVPLQITVELGRASKKVRDVLGLGPGSIVELSKLAGEPVDLLVNGKAIAKGEVVVIDENFAVRIIEILAREERLAGGL